MVLVETYARQPRATECRYLLGQRNCAIWPKLQLGGFANVETSHASDKMDNDYLAWRALSDLQTYTELVWIYPVDVGNAALPLNTAEPLQTEEEKGGPQLLL